MASNLKRLDSYLVPGKHIHLIGIGGVSMRPLGLVLRGMGITVTGSDMNASVSTDELVAKGIEVHIGHRAENIQGADCIIRTAAAHTTTIPRSPRPVRRASPCLSGRRPGA